MITSRIANEGFEISPRFRRSVEERIARLERDAEHDEALVGISETAIIFAGTCAWWPATS